VLYRGIIYGVYFVVLPSGERDVRRGKWRSLSSYAKWRDYCRRDNALAPNFIKERLPNGSTAYLINPRYTPAAPVRLISPPLPRR